MAKGPYIKTDKFGRPYQLLGMSNRNGNDNFPSCCVELKGQLYVIEVSAANGNAAEGRKQFSHWCKVTAVSKKKQHTSM